MTTRWILRPRRPGWKGLGAAMLVLAWGGNHFTPLLLFYEGAEHFTSLEVDLFLATYVVGLVPGFLVVGPISDRYGRKPLLLAGLLLGALASVILALGPGSLALMCVGRFVAGLSVAIAMVVGTAWMKELSSPPYDDEARPSTGARRASLSLTIGLGAGAGVSGALVQWGPLPALLPYAMQIVVTVIALVALIRVPSPRPRGRSRGDIFSDLRIPRTSRRRFLGVIVPSAPWVFTSAALAYAVEPTLVSAQTGSNRIAFATLLTVVTLGAGTLIQPFAPRLAVLTRHRNLVLGVAIGAIGTVLTALTAATHSLGLAVVASAVLGLCYGLTLVSGLVEVQRSSHPDDLAGVTAIFYSLTYVGFLVPVALAALSVLASYPRLLIGFAGIGVVCAVVTLVALTRRTGRGEASGQHLEVEIAARQDNQHGAVP